MEKERDFAFRNEIEALSYKFLDFNNEYHNNKSNSEIMTEYVTQPFWQSMFLSKKRLDKNDVTVTTTFTKEKESSQSTSSVETNLSEIDICSQGIDVLTDGVNEVGLLVRKVQSKSTYEHHKKIIYSKKDHDIIQMSMIRSKVENGQAACINCGFIGPVSSFIDGCDACNSKYTVNDFQTKVAGFTIDENSNYKIKKSFSGVIKIMLFIVLLIDLFGLFFIYTSYKQGKFFNLSSRINNFNDIKAVLFIFGILTGTLLLSIFYSYLILLVIRVIFQKKYGKLFVNEDKVKNLYNNFSLYDFMQKIEYKLRNLHFAENPKELESYMHFDTSHYIEKYNDVIDCSIVSMKFLNAKDTGEGYNIKVDAKLRLITFKHGKIKTKYENIIFSVYGKKGVVDKKITTIRYYKCPTCSSNLNVLEGSKCSYCGNTYDYTNFDWIITDYKINTKTNIIQKYIYWRIRICVPVVYVLNFILSGVTLVYGFFGVYINDVFIYEKQEINYNSLDEILNEIVLINNIDMSIDDGTVSSNKTNVIATYNLSMFSSYDDNIIKTFSNALKINGYIILDDYGKKITAERKVKINNNIKQIYVYITFIDDNKVQFEIIAED